ncbi:hypothetical protein ROSMUCSMR3_03586 [Roseovarius mucosus]|uniref:Uncharacterized protein n=1 Tax=Roseovarius mucosus TaxID=215743 RepID=A0A1V0RTD6_9RHOB|nr:hypothetical protein [Roseovarius mucosus]ARE85040.1 hypothetical protein ROSMUCSMR3_03586 [Roseovarius mucosus]
MIWLENPTVAGVLGGVAGALVAGLISVFIWRSSRTRRRVRAVIRDVTSLLEISENLKSTLNIEIQGKKVESLFLTSVDVSNVGNVSIEDQNILIVFPKNTEIVDFSLTTDPQLGFDGVKAEIKENTLKTSASLLNVGDKLTFEIISTGNASESVEVVMRNKDVEEELVDARSGDLGLSFLLSEKNLLMLAVISTVPFFGGFARSMINVGVANRIDNLNRQRR